MTEKEPPDLDDLLTPYPIFTEEVSPESICHNLFDEIVRGAEDSDHRKYAGEHMTNTAAHGNLVIFQALGDAMERHFDTGKMALLARKILEEFENRGYKKTLVLASFSTRAVSVNAHDIEDRAVPGPDENARCLALRGQTGQKNFQAMSIWPGFVLSHRPWTDIGELLIRFLGKKVPRVPASAPDQPRLAP
ncbi:MAG: hypothetical protein M3O22_05780 [Pseudomonadota bacterium]|nr:hypothetical protein [Pseudomonadota bacterium]